MKFLDLVAKDIIARFGNDLSEVVMVFPNIRSRIFFDEYIANATDKPLFSPRYEDFDSLFRQASSLREADNLMLISILYKIYVKYFYRNREETETFDEFFFFGETLLRDFEEIDKYLIDAKKLYRNISDLEQLSDDFEHLTQEQVNLLNRFFADIKTNPTRIKDNFISVWSILADVYSDFKAELTAKGLAYNGMIYRDVIEKWNTSAPYYNKENYVFVGFNVLSVCEEKLMENLRPQSLYYWDYDEYFFDNPFVEAGKFIKKNMEKFPPAAVFETHNIEKPKNISIISTSTEVAQASYIPTFIDSLKKKEWLAPDTAIVFCNEQTLLPAMRFIPTNVDKINVTMGFPLNQTPVYDFIIRLLNLQQKGIKNGKFHHTHVLSIINHYYTSLIVGDTELQDLKDKIIDNRLFLSTAEELNIPLIFRCIETSEDMINYLLDIVQAVGIKAKDADVDFARINLLNEAIFRVFRILNRISDLTSQGYLDIKLPTLISLIKRILSAESVPFHGEPARGLQLMGMLETRNLDFDNLIIMSLNEGIMPKAEQQASFIPQFIRRSVGMSCLEHQDAIFAYYFYRLLQRADNVALSYSTASNGIVKSEMSRFLMQIITELPNHEKIRRISIQSDVSPTVNQPIVIEKTPSMMERIIDKFSITGKSNIQLSPTAINSFIDCPLQFYLRYIEGVKEPDELTDELDNKILGTVIHRTIEIIYRHLGGIAPLIAEKNRNSFTPFEVGRAKIEQYAGNRKLIDELLEKAFSVEFFGRPTPRSLYNGEHLIYFGVARNFIRKILLFDAANAPFVIHKMEGYERHTIALANGISVDIGGYVDRMRIKDNTLFVDDYKVSTAENKLGTLSGLFEENAKKHPKHILQAFYYGLIMSKNYPTNDIVPLLLYLPRIKSDIPYIKIGTGQNAMSINDFRLIASEFEAMLCSKIEEIFDPTKPFEANTSTESCQWCDFKNICGKYK